VISSSALVIPMVIKAVIRASVPKLRPMQWLAPV
jgi:hypothetical protein